MDRKNFGKLLSALRKEHRDEEDLPWTQKFLAGEADLPLHKVRSIEQGECVKIDSETLTKLADALQLTVLERREFFLASLNIRTTKMNDSLIEPLEILESIIETVQSITLPAFLLDAYGDFLCLNKTLATLMRVTPDIIVNATEKPDGYNLMRIIFAPDSPFREQVGPNEWERSARHNIQTFRAISFRYRMNPYFERLFHTLCGYRRFKGFWKDAHRNEGDIHFANSIHCYDHCTYGRLNYLTNISHHHTREGELHLAIYNPINDATGDVFQSIYEKSGRNIIRLNAIWPKPEIVLNE